MNELTEGKSYWKSLERLYDSPAVREALEKEFPDDASLSPKGLARRRMLHLMGASFALAGLASCRRPQESIVPFTEAPEDYVPGVAKHYASTMQLGTAAYGIVVESHEGRPTKIEGNELHPASRGAANAWMQASLLDLYDPDRSSNVHRRVEKRKELEPSSWDGFLDAWRSAASSFENTNGRGLAVLTESYASASFAKVARELKERFPGARWAVYEPAGDENVFSGSKLATGRALRPIYHLGRAKRVLSLDCDFLMAEAGAVTHAKQFARARNPEGHRDVNRLYVVESTLTTTGAQADHRIPVPSLQIPLFLLHLACELGATEASLPRLDDALAHAVRVVAEDLASRPGEALITVGRHQPPEAHAAVLVLNDALGAFGSTVTLDVPTDTEWGETGALVALVDAMTRGEIDTLIMLGGNPVYDAPADLDFAAAMENVETTVHLSSHLDETSRLADWHLPRAHFLESWGDARALDGTRSIVQPLIAPLFGGQSALETLAVLVSDDRRDGFGLVRDAWLPGILGDENVETKWNRALHDGLFAEDSASDVPFQPDDERKKLVLEALAREASESQGGLELLFTLSPAVHDGRFANNGWLQELADPITKLTWDNAALISPRTAERLGLASGDIVSIQNGAMQVTAPVLVSPGQADESMSLAVGYGRWAAGRVGDGVGVNAHTVRSASAPFLQTGVVVSKQAGRHALALTQEHWSMEGREPIRESTVDPDLKIIDFATKSHDDDDPRSLWPLLEEPRLDGEFQWGMVIDLNACQGCNACIVACQAENNIPIVGKEQVLRGREMQWLRVDRYFSGHPENPEVSFQPVPCMHCENAPCEQVCPVGATLHDREGINAMVYNRCIGTRYCSNNCPYKVRRFNFFNYTKDIPEITSMAMNPDVTVRSRGVMEKCTYCIQRINETKRSGKTSGNSSGHLMMTACQQTCPTEAITFGNLADPDSPVSKLKKSPRNYVLLEELFAKPRTSYLTKLRNPNPAWFRG